MVQGVQKWFFLPDGMRATKRIENRWSRAFIFCLKSTLTITRSNNSHMLVDKCDFSLTNSLSAQCIPIHQILSSGRKLPAVLNAPLPSRSR